MAETARRVITAALVTTPAVLAVPLTSQRPCRRLDLSDDALELARDPLEVRCLRRADDAELRRLFLRLGPLARKARFNGAANDGDAAKAATAKARARTSFMTSP